LQIYNPWGPFHVSVVLPVTPHLLGSASGHSLIADPQALLRIVAPNLRSGRNQFTKPSIKNMLLVF